MDIDDTLDPAADFVMDYRPDLEQLSTWFEECPDEAVKTILAYNNAAFILREAYNETHLEDIVQEYEDERNQ